MNEFDENKKKNGFIGYAHVYLLRCNKESKPHDEIDIDVFTRLAELDSKLGKTAAAQLFQILFQTTRLDIIKVSYLCFYRLSNYSRVSTLNK